jgi:hypothetical protein
MHFLPTIGGGEEGPHRAAAGWGRSSAAAGRSRGRQQHVGNVAGASRSGRWPRRSPAAAAPGRRPPSRPQRLPAAMTARRRPPPAGPGRRRAPPSWLSPPAQDHAWRRSAASPALALRRLPWATLPWLGQPEKRERAWRPAGADPRARPSSGCSAVNRRGEEEQENRSVGAPAVGERESPERPVAVAVGWMWSRGGGLRGRRKMREGERGIESRERRAAGAS